MNTPTRKQMFLNTMRDAQWKTQDPVAYGYLDLHIRNVLPMSEKKFAAYEKKMREIIKKNGPTNPVTVNKLREMAKAGG